jgi:hypothetical protein
MSRESAIVVGGMLAIVVVLAVIRVTYDDIKAVFVKASPEEIAQAQEAIQELQRSTDALDTSRLIAAVAPCEQGRDLNTACLTVTDNWAGAANRQQVATDIWKSWASICTSRKLAADADECFIRVKSASGETLGGSGDGDASRIWVKQQ